MSWKKDRISAQRELTENNDKLNFRLKEKRETRHVRIRKSLHEKLRQLARENQRTMSKYLDDLVESALIRN